MSSNRNGTPWYTPSTDENAAPQNPSRNTARPIGPISWPMRSASSRHSRGPSSRIAPCQLICVDRKIIEKQKMKTSANDRVRSVRADGSALRPAPARLAHPVAVGEQRHRAADAADERQRVGDRERRPRASARPVGARPQHDQQRRGDDGAELQADEPLDDREEALVAADPHHRQRGQRVDHAPHRQRHAGHDGGRHQRAGRDERARDEVAPDDEVEEERADGHGAAARRASPRSA